MFALLLVLAIGLGSAIGGLARRRTRRTTLEAYHRSIDSTSVAAQAGFTNHYGSP